MRGLCTGSSVCIEEAHCLDPEAFFRSSDIDSRMTGTLPTLIQEFVKLMIIIKKADAASLLPQVLAPVLADMQAQPEPLPVPGQPTKADQVPITHRYL